MIIAIYLHCFGRKMIFRPGHCAARIILMVIAGSF